VGRQPSAGEACAAWEPTTRKKEARVSYEEYDFGTDAAPGEGTYSAVVVYATLKEVMPRRIDYLRVGFGLADAPPGEDGRLPVHWAWFSPAAIEAALRAMVVPWPKEEFELDPRTLRGAKVNIKIKTGDRGKLVVDTLEAA
jgi:hypothetical protein